MVQTEAKIRKEIWESEPSKALAAVVWLLVSACVYGRAGVGGGVEVPYASTPRTMIVNRAWTARMGRRSAESSMVKRVEMRWWMGLRE